MGPFIAVHAGAGVHKNGIAKVCADAVRSSGGNVVSAIKALENDGMTNCAFGSNLTIGGRVECEAALTSSACMTFGAVGSVCRLRNPIVTAEKLMRLQEGALCGARLIPPSVLVGAGAEEFALEQGIETCEPDFLISEERSQEWRKAKKIVAAVNRRVPEEENEVVVDIGRMDTVGAVSLDDLEGLCSAGCSSGGIILKHSGRLGHCTQVGGAVWAQQSGATSVAVSTSGCGEYIARCRLAERVAIAVLEWKSDEGLLTDCVRNVFEKDFLKSPLLRFCAKDRVLAGGIVVFLDKDERYGEFIAFHNTPHLAFAFTDGAVVRKVCSKQPSKEAHLLIQSFPFHL